MKKLLILLLLVCSVAFAEDEFLLENNLVLTFDEVNCNSIVIYSGEETNNYTNITMEDEAAVFGINGEELIRATKDGRFYINGKLTTIDSEIYEAFLKWFEFLQKGE
jgi:hypothetical protein